MLIDKLMSEGLNVARWCVFAVVLAACWVAAELARKVVES